MKRINKKLTRSLGNLKVRITSETSFSRWILFVLTTAVMKKKQTRKEDTDQTCSNQANITICLCTYLLIADSTVLSRTATKQTPEESVGVKLGQNLNHDKGHPKPTFQLFL